jgi:hypothetical protein
MTCEDFERVLPELEGNQSSEQEQHLRTCSACSGLVSDLNAITENARLLQDSEPGPQVWNSLEAALRREGLIRPQLRIVAGGTRSPRWRFAWLVPIAAAALFGAGLLGIHRHVNNQLARQQSGDQPLVPTASAPNLVPSSDEDPVLKLVSTRTPAMRASYESNLRAVEAYIRDAESSVRDNPNDDIAQQYLTNAYEQRAMIYEMAMHRSMP